jgi:hypothetical protein
MITPSALLALIALSAASAEPPPEPDAPMPDAPEDVSPVAPVVTNDESSVPEVPINNDTRPLPPDAPVRENARTRDPLDEEFGGVMAPVVLPATAMSTYVYAGFSELGAGYRYGLGLVELEARVKADYRLVSLAAEGVVKVSVLQRDGFQLAPYLGIGFVGDAGAEYITAANFAYAAVRVLGGANVSYRLTDTVYLLGALEMTLDLAVSTNNAYRFAPLLGPGAEFYLTRALSISVMGLLGPDVFQPHLVHPTVELGYGVRVGVGFRIF